MQINIYTDGACKGNPGHGSWAFIVYIDGQKKESFGDYDPNTTNNKMELTAILQALQYIFHNNLNEGSTITIFSDSKYCLNSINMWMDGWARKNWKDVKNPELMKAIYDLKNKLPGISYQYIEAHSGKAGNEDVDALCNEIIKRQHKLS